MDGVHALSPAWSMRTYSMRMRSVATLVMVADPGKAKASKESVPHAA